MGSGKHAWRGLAPWAALLGAAVALACSEPAELAEPPADPPAAAAPEATPEPLPEFAENGSYWLLSEFDWGDEREVVYESTQFDPWYECRKKFDGICALTRVDVDGEELLAHFHFLGPGAKDGLFQMVFLTPDLDPAQADAHLARVWELLAGYANAHLGEPAEAGEMPDRDGLAFGPPRVTHVWRDPRMVGRLAVGRRDTDLFYVALSFNDPSAETARQAQLVTLAESDERKREKRAQRNSRRPPAGSGAAGAS
ncbi:MAG: hypothetical protein ACQGVC_20960 [Myxococcota bacterium]